MVMDVNGIFPEDLTWGTHTKGLQVHIGEGTTPPDDFVCQPQLDEEPVTSDVPQLIRWGIENIVAAEEDPAVAISTNVEEVMELDVISEDGEKIVSLMGASLWARDPDSDDSVQLTTGNINGMRMHGLRLLFSGDVLDAYEHVVLDDFVKQDPPLSAMQWFATYEIPDYADDPEGFKREMLELAEILEEPV